MNKNLPRTYIRIDVAHYVKNWANFLSTEKKQIKQFYMFAIGQLILCRNETVASRLLKALLIISKSETAGAEARSLKEALIFVKSLIIEETKFNTDMEKIVNINVEKEIENNAEQNNVDEETEESEGNKQSQLRNLAKQLESEVDDILSKENGDDINPRACPKFATRLLKQIETMPLWSCFRRDAFGYGRVPASSAPVESEFKTLKSYILPNIVRLDVSVETLVKYYSGKLKLIECSKSSIKIKEVKNKYLQEIPEILIDTIVLPIVGEKQTRTSSTSSRVSSFCDKENLVNKNCTDSPEKRLVSERSPLKDITAKRNSNNKDCTACINGDYPTGAHVCILCKSYVHLLPGCSIAKEEENEGHGEKRICISCSEDSTISTRMAFHTNENWRGLGSPKKKIRRAFYLQKANLEILDHITSQSYCTLPIIKNGNNAGLSAVTINNAKITVTNTCAFDSIFQILLAAVTDYEVVRTYVEKQQSNNALFQMVLGVKNTKLSIKAYRKRTEILLDYWKTKIQPNTIALVDCACNIISLLNFIFKNSPSFEEISICSAGCKPRKKSLPSISISEKELQVSLGTVIKNHVVLPGVACQQENCQAMEENDIHAIGTNYCYKIEV